MFWVKDTVTSSRKDNMMYYTGMYGDECLKELMEMVRDRLWHGVGVLARIFTARAGRGTAMLRNADKQQRVSV